MPQLPPVPMRSPVLQNGPADPDRRSPFMAVLHREIVNFLTLLRTAIGTAAQLVGFVELEDQSATIATTDISTPPLTEGLYRVTYSLRITQAATVSSSAQLTLGWTQHSVSATQTFAAVTGNTTATQQSGTITVFSDAGAAITYQVTYASVGLTSMEFSLDVLVEGLP